MMSRKRPLILLSNDDGVHAQGLLHLKRAMKAIGEVIVVAPDRPRSSCSHSITLHKPLRVFEWRDEDGDIVYACNGMPADCVILGIRVLCGRMPDLVIGGINDGPNLGDDIIYSGTVAVAREAALEGCRAFAISVAGFENIHYETAALVAKWLAKQLLKIELPRGVFLNVNVPNLPLEQLKGLKITKRGFKHYVGPQKSGLTLKVAFISGEALNDLSVKICQALMSARSLQASSPSPHSMLTPLSHHCLKSYGSGSYLSATQGHSRRLRTENEVNFKASQRLGRTRRR